MTGRRYADDVCMCGQHADDIPACGRCADDMRMTCRRRMSSATWNLQRSLTLVLSAHRPRVICTSSARRTHETSVPRLFQVKQQRTALLKILANGVKKFDLRWWSPIWLEIQSMICTNIIGIKSSFVQCTKHVHCTNNQCSLWTEINVTFHHVLPCHFYAINIFYICFFF